MYLEGELPVFTNSNGNNNGGMWGSDGIWAILLLALLGGRGFGWGGGNGGFDNLGYHLGQVATTNDVAAGFNNSAVLANQNDAKLQLANGFAGVDNAICTLGYQAQQGFNDLGSRIDACCCQTQRAIEGVNYNMATNTCQIVQAINCGNQRIIDYLQGEKIDTLNRKLAIAEGQISQANQTATLLNAINRTPIAAYTVPNPYCCYTQNSCCGCGNNF